MKCNTFDLYGGLNGAASITVSKAVGSKRMGIDTSALRIGRSFSPFAGPVDNLRNG